MSSIFPSGAVRVLRALFSSSKEETIGFVRFHDETIEANEVTLANGTFKSEGCYGGSETEGEAGKKENGMLPMSIEPVKDTTLEDKKQERNRITAWQAGWNVTNAIQGMFIVTFPYAVYEGGYWAVVSMVIVAWICCYTGKILVECLYETDDEGVEQRVRTSYVEVAECVWGKKIGGRIVNCAQIIELLMTCILYILLCGDLMIGSFPNTPLDLASWIMVSSTFLLPCAFLKSLRAVSWLSFWCTVAHMFINAIILIYCFTLIKDWHWTDVQFRVDMWTFPISFGIVIFSYTSQIFLPTLEGNLVDRSQFKTMLHWTHIAAAVFKALFSYIGFVTFGFATKEVITNNLTNRGLKIIVNLFLVAKALLSYPLPYFAAADLLEEALFKGKPYTVGPTCFDGAGSLKVWALTLRILLVAVTVIMAIFIPHFAILMGLIGSFTGNMLSLVWPCYFHLRIKGHVMKLRYKFVDIFIIIIGFLCAILGIYYNFHALVKAFQGIEPRPFQGGLPKVHTSTRDET